MFYTIISINSVVKYSKTAEKNLELELDIDKDLNLFNSFVFILL